MTFAQFLFVALEGLRNQVEWGSYGPRLKPTKVPLSRWVVLVTLFFVVSVLNNLALGYRISMPLHIIFRSGGLFANMVLGAIILGKRYIYYLIFFEIVDKKIMGLNSYWIGVFFRYPTGQVVGVGLVTMGVVWATLDNANMRVKGVNILMFYIHP